MNLLGVVLAGGRSTRMGADKALLTWAGDDGASVSLVEHAARRLEGTCERVEVAAGDSDTVREACADRWSAFADAVPDAGPLGALAAGLERAAQVGADGILALACDLPLVGEGELEPLRRALSGGADAALWRTEPIGGEARDHPLVAAYRTGFAAPARRALERGSRRVIAMFEPDVNPERPPRVERLVADASSEQRLVNLNTRTDYDRARRRAGLDSDA